MATVPQLLINTATTAPLFPNTPHPSTSPPCTAHLCPQLPPSPCLSPIWATVPSSQALSPQFTCCIPCAGRAGGYTWAGGGGNHLVSATRNVLLSSLVIFQLSDKFVHKPMSKLQLYFSWKRSATKYIYIFNGSATCFSQYFINYYYQCE